MKHYHNKGIFFLLIFITANGNSWARITKSLQIMEKTVSTSPGKKIAGIYLDKNDPVLKAIRSRAVTDLKQSVQRTNPRSEENQAIAKEITTWTKEKQDQLPGRYDKSMNDYTKQLHFDVTTFRRAYTILARLDEKQLTTEYDLRVQCLGENKYAAEFWEDGLTIKPLTHALASTENVDNNKSVDESYAVFRKSIEEGKHERFTKILALLYTCE
jgi:hypothetical protein